MMPENLLVLRVIEDLVELVGARRVDIVLDDEVVKRSLRCLAVVL